VFHRVDNTYIIFSHSRISSKGSAEDELGDGEPKYTKLRPMRVEMFLCVPVGAILAVAQLL